MTFHNGPKDPVNGLVAWNGHIQDEEMPEIKQENVSMDGFTSSASREYRSFRHQGESWQRGSACPGLENIYSFNILFASYRQIDEVARLVQTVEPLLFDDSTEQLIGDLNKGQLSRLLCHEQHGMVT